VPTIWLRVIYGVLLFAVLWNTYATNFPSHDIINEPFSLPARAARSSQIAREMQRFSASFVFSVLAIQGCVVVLLTPAYLASAVAEEKEHRTLELLFTTPLLDREIILGKLLSRVSHLGMILLTGLPLLLFLQSWGGLPPGELLAAFATAGLSLLSIGSLSMVCSTRSRRIFQALVASYVLVLPLTFLGMACLPLPITSPLSYLLNLERRYRISGMLSELVFGGKLRRPEPSPLSSVVLLLAYAAFHLTITGACVAFAVRNLRRNALGRDAGGTTALARNRRPAVRGMVVVDEHRPRSWDAPVDRQRPSKGSSQAPAAEKKSRTAGQVPVSDYPFLWKEMSHQAGPWLTRWRFRTLFPAALLLLLLGLVIAGFVACYLLASRNPQQPLGEALEQFLTVILNRILRSIFLALAGLWCVLAGLRAAGTVAVEREQRTLASLLLLPVPRWLILNAKCFGSAARFRVLGVGLLAVGTVGVLLGAFHPLAIVLLTVVCALHLAFLSSLGVWVSLASRNSLWAYCTMIMALVLIFAGWFLALMYARVLFATTLGGTGWWYTFLEVGLNPARTCWHFGFSWWDQPPELASWQAFLDGDLTAVVAGQGVLVALTLVLWAASYLHFRREQPIGS
jgi:ABC-type transport system involved in multi-copper enzyme maturation permease subunit